MLTSDSILKMEDPYKDFVVCIDASKEDVKGVLLYEGHVISYESRKLKADEKTMLLVT